MISPSNQEGGAAFLPRNLPYLSAFHPTTSDLPKQDRNPTVDQSRIRSEHGGGCAARMRHLLTTGIARGAHMLRTARMRCFQFTRAPFRVHACAGSVSRVRCKRLDACCPSRLKGNKSYFRNKIDIAAMGFCKDWKNEHLWL